MAAELSARLTYVQYDLRSCSSASIQYYLTYSTYKERVSQIELAYFTHLEEQTEAKHKFFTCASKVDHCVSQSEKYANLISAQVSGKVTVIAPGIDLALYRPKLRLGVVGRAYHTGRKGEDLVRQLMHLKDVEWHFTGSGWPGPALNLLPNEMPLFYRSMDYIVVPSHYEGGPMCIPEAVACGTPVISSDVGWAQSFPHIPFKNGDVSDLRRVIQELLKIKRSRAEAALSYSWNSWASQHDILFSQYLPKVISTGVTQKRRNADREQDPVGSIALVLHGNEASSKGGPSVRVPRTAELLRARGTDARLLQISSNDASHDVCHVFNAWSPDSALSSLRRSSSIKAKTVFSPIFLDLRERWYWDDLLPQILYTDDPNARDAALERAALDLKVWRTEKVSPHEVEPGYTAKLEEMLSLSDHVVFLSEHERNKLKESLSTETSFQYTVVQNPVDSERFSSADPELFIEAFGLRRFVLCVARIEPRKNQLLIVHALRSTNLPVVFIGHAPPGKYTEAFKASVEDCPTATHIDRIPSDSELLASAYAAASVVILPSWSEGAPLVALEAAAAGAQLVLSDRSSEREYFGDAALYCDPGSPESIRHAVFQAMSVTEGARATRRDQIRKLVAETFSWKSHIDQTLVAYLNAKTSPQHSQVPLEIPQARQASLAQASQQHNIESIVFDLTTLLNHKGRWTGIARVESQLAQGLYDQATGTQLDIIFVAWHAESRQFVPIRPAAFDPEAVQSALGSALLSPPDATFYPRQPFVVSGSAWMQNERYVVSLISFAKRKELRLFPVIHDLIPIARPRWFSDGYSAVFERNLNALLSAAHGAIAVSQQTKLELTRHYGALSDTTLLIGRLHEGSDVKKVSEPAKNSRKRYPVTRKFVLSVGAIHARKNPVLLRDIWIELVARVGDLTPMLVLVGGIARGSDDIAAVLLEDPRLTDHILLLEDVSDSELESLYGNCAFTIYPSLYEGWGLPIAESLSYGKPCLATDASAMREVSPELTDLLPAHDSSAWVARITTYLRYPEILVERKQQICNKFHAQSWTSSAGGLLSEISHLANQDRLSTKYFGEILSFSDVRHFASFAGQGWHGPESWGMWSSSTICTIRLRTASAMLAPAVLVAELSSFAEARKGLRTKVSINGVQIAVWSVDPSGRTPYIAHIAPELLRSSETIVEFSIEHLVSIQSFKPNSTDMREVGFAIRRMQLVPKDLVGWESTSLLTNALIVEPGEYVDFYRHAKYRTLFSTNEIVDPFSGVQAFNSELKFELHLLDELANTDFLRLYVRIVPKEARPTSLRVSINGHNWISQPISAQNLYSVDISHLQIGASMRLALHIRDASLDEVSTEPQPTATVGLIGLEVASGSAGPRVTVPNFFAIHQATGLRDTFCPAALCRKLEGAESRISNWTTFQSRFYTAFERSDSAYIYLCIRRGDEFLTWPEEWKDLVQSKVNGQAVHLTSSSGHFLAVDFANQASIPNFHALEVYLRNDFLDMLEIASGALDVWVTPNSNLSFVKSDLRETTDSVWASLGASRHANTPQAYSEDAYLRANPDVHAAVTSGVFQSGRQHWLLHGKSENRKLVP